MAQADEENTILAESSGTMVIDEAEIDDELAALEGEEKRREEEAQQRSVEAENKRKEAAAAEETRKQLESAGAPSAVEPVDQAAIEVGRMSLEENVRQQQSAS